MLKPYLLENIRCPVCTSEFIFDEFTKKFACTSCDYAVNSQHGIPLFTPPPPDLIPSEKLERGPRVGTPWRKANWGFLLEQVAALEQEALILDVGAGRGDFSAAFKGRSYLALDVYPYPEVDLVCDLTQRNPFHPARFDAIVLMNVMEHIFDTHAIMATLRQLLKPNGILIVAIPFMVKIHQAPVDYVRFTHYALQRLGDDHRLETVLVEGYYDPIFFLEEGIGNLRNAFLPTLKGNQHHFARIMLSGIQNLANLLRSATGEGTCQPPSQVRSKAPTGYHIVYRKPV